MLVETLNPAQSNPIVLGRAVTKDFCCFWQRSREQLSVPADFCFNTALQRYLADENFTEENRSDQWPLLTSFTND